MRGGREQEHGVVVVEEVVCVGRVVGLDVVVREAVCLRERVGELAWREQLRLACSGCTKVSQPAARLSGRWPKL